MTFLHKDGKHYLKSLRKSRNGRTIMIIILLKITVINVIKRKEGNSRRPKNQMKSKFNIVMGLRSLIIRKFTELRNKDAEDATG